MSNSGEIMDEEARNKRKPTSALATVIAHMGLAMGVAQPTPRNEPYSLPGKAKRKAARKRQKAARRKQR